MGLKVKLKSLNFNRFKDPKISPRHNRSDLLFKPRILKYIRLQAIQIPLAIQPMAQDNQLKQ